MTMYLPNPELDPTGAEPGEFIDEFIDGHDADEPGGRNGSGVGGETGATARTADDVGVYRHPPA